MYMSNYAIYLRKSRADAEAEARGEGETLARHRAALTELAKRQKLPIVKVYEEIVSGDSIAARPQMQALLSDVEKRSYEGVLVMEVERLARGDTIDQGIVAQAFKNSDTKIITPIKTYDPDNEFDEEYFEFALFMSRREYKTIKRRMQAGRLAAVKEGNYIGQRDPFGYKKINPDHKVHTLEVIPEQAEIVKLIFDMYLKGSGAKAIARELNKMGVKPQKRDLWEAPSIKKILSNPLYIGKVRWQTKSSGDTLYEGMHDAIISEDVFYAVQNKRKNSPAVQTPNNKTVKNYYNKVLYCENCGHQMRRRSIGGYEHMLCTYAECRGKVVSSKIENVNEAVLSAIRYRLEELESLKSINSTEKIIKIDKRTPLVREHEKLKKQLSKLHDLLEQEIYDLNTFLERSEKIKSDINKVETAIKEVEAEEEKAESIDSVITKLNNVIDRFESANADEKNRLLKSVCSKIVYHKTQKMCNNNRNSDLSVMVYFT